MSKAKTPKKTPKRAKKPQAPCEACKGFMVPARRVATVARAANGRFKRTPKQRGLF